MQLEQYPRVIFRKPPLALTLAQIRFTPRFRIEDPPRLAAFQEAIEGSYPRFDRETQMGIMVSPRGLQAQPGQELLRFSTHDLRTSAVLAPDALTLEIRQYGTIEQLQAEFRTAAAPLIEHFRPPSQLRIGLRFVNEFRHPKGDSTVSWRALLNPDLVGMTGSAPFGDSVQESLQQLTIRDEGFTVIVRHGFFPQGTTVPTPERTAPADGPFYLLDLDCFKEETRPLDIDGAIEDFSSFNSTLYNIFRWTLGEDLFESFEPVEG